MKVSIQSTLVAVLKPGEILSGLQPKRLGKFLLLSMLMLLPGIGFSQQTYHAEFLSKEMPDLPFEGERPSFGNNIRNPSLYAFDEQDRLLMLEFDNTLLFNLVRFDPETGLKEDIDDKSYYTQNPRFEYYVQDGKVFEINAATMETRWVAGNGEVGFSGDGGPAREATLNDAFWVDADGEGNIYISDEGNFRVRKVDAQTGIITTVAGNGIDGSLDDTMLAKETSISGFSQIVVNEDGDIYLYGEFLEIARIDAETNRIIIQQALGAFGGLIRLVPNGPLELNDLEDGVSFYDLETLEPISLDLPFEFENTCGFYIGDFGQVINLIISDNGASAYNIGGGEFYYFTSQGELRQPIEEDPFDYRNIRDFKFMPDGRIVFLNRQSNFISVNPGERNFKNLLKEDQCLVQAQNFGIDNEGNIIILDENLFVLKAGENELERFGFNFDDVEDFLNKIVVSSDQSIYHANGNAIEKFEKDVKELVPVISLENSDNIQNLIPGLNGKILFHTKTSIYEYDPATCAINLISGGASPGRFVSGKSLKATRFESIDDIFLDVNGILYVLDGQNRKIQKLDIFADRGKMVLSFEDLILPDGSRLDQRFTSYNFEFDSRGDLYLEIEGSILRVDFNRRSQGILNLALVDAESDAFVRNLEPVNDISIFNRELTIEALLTPDFQSVKFYLNGEEVRVESQKPYVISSDRRGDYNEWDVNPGSYELCVVPYARRDAKGRRGQKKCVVLNINNNKNLEFAESLDLITVIRGEEVNEKVEVNSNSTQQLMFDIEGLPDFLTLDQYTGEISGSAPLGFNEFSFPFYFEVYPLKITVSDGYNSISKTTKLILGETEFVSYSLIDTRKDKVIMNSLDELSSGIIDRYGPDLTLQANLNIDSIVNPNNKNVVKFEFRPREGDGIWTINMEKNPPYALGGDFPRGNFRPFEFPQQDGVICASVLDDNGENVAVGCIFYDYFEVAESIEGTFYSKPGNYKRDQNAEGMIQFTLNQTTNELDLVFQNGPFNLADFEGSDRTGILDGAIVSYFLRIEENENGEQTIRLRINDNLGRIIYDSQDGDELFEDATTRVTLSAAEQDKKSSISDSRLEVGDKSDLTLAIYPNPFNDRINLSIPFMDVETVQWSITDLQGRRVMQDDAITGTISELDVSRLTRGIYILTIDAGSEKQSFRLVK